MFYKRSSTWPKRQLRAGRAKIEGTVRYLGIEVDDALALSKQVEL